MTLPRVVRPEILDGLDPADPAAVRSRRDLVRVHLAMGTRRALARALAGPPRAPSRPSGPDAATRAAPLDVLELGGGDGTLTLALARRVARAWPPVRLTLLDRVDVVSAATRAGYAALGWEIEVLRADVLEWAEPAAEGDDPSGPTRRRDLVLASLFLHHFEGEALRRLLGAVAARTDRLVAFEPRRSGLALAGSRLIGALGANAVTRSDAVASVRAGFRGGELAALWPARGWHLDERPSPPFGHLLDARRDGACRAQVPSGAT